MKDLNTRLSRLSLMDRQATQISTYIEYLVRANKRISLTRLGEFEDWFVNHVEDSVKAYDLFKDLPLDSFVDCGSGNGLPGIIFGILSNKPFVLCDVDQRKCEFLKSIVFKLKLSAKVFPKPISKFKTPNKGKTCFVYRGLGPDSILVENFKLNPKSLHFRFVSSNQTSLFAASKRENYFLSDKSSREIEISL